MADPMDLPRLLESIRDTRFTMFTTVDGEGRPRGRPMTTLDASDGGSLWFFGVRDSEMVDEARAEPRVGLAYSNLGGAYAEGKQYVEAERCYREALRRYADTLPAGHLYVGITRLKLGRTFLRSKRYVEAERETRAAYEIVLAQAEPSVRWLENARNDLVAEYEALGKPEEAAKFRAELAAAGGNK